MGSSDDRKHSYFQLEDLTRRLPDTGLRRIGLSLLADVSGRDWRALGDRLNYSMTEMDGFAGGHRTNPGYTILRDWSTKERSTIGTLRSALQRIERHDVISILDDIRENPIILYVVIYDPVRFSLNAEIRGKLELWEGLTPHLQSHLQNQNATECYSFCELGNATWTWRTSCHSLQGQQIDIKITHQDNDPSIGNARLEEMIPQWHLVTPSTLRFSRRTTPGYATDATHDQFSDKRDEPSNKPRCAYSHNSVSASAVAPPPPPTARSRSVLPSAASSDIDVVTHHFQETLKLRSGSHCESLPVQCTSWSLRQTGLLPEISLRSEHEPSENWRRDRDPGNIAQAVDLRSPVENEYLELNAETMDETGFLAGRSVDGSVKEVDAEEPQSSRHGSNVLTSGNETIPVQGIQGSGAKSEQEETDSNRKTAFNTRENHSANPKSSGKYVNFEERAKKRHVHYGLPTAEAIREQCPELWSLPGFHPKLKHKTCLIKSVMKPYEQTDGWYLIRVFNCDDDLGIVQVALTVSHRGKFKHYKILHRQDSNPRRYFLFNHDYESATISELIDHYRTHPMVPCGYEIDLTSVPKLIKPIPTDSSCFTINE